MWIKIGFILVLCFNFKVRSQFHECDDDPDETPDSGIMYEPKFTWLGALQYIHIKTGNPHYFRVPRVVLISRQFVLSTAVDASQIPNDYALGNVAFSEYDRDEIECSLTPQMIVEGKQCDRAILLVPIADVLVHPEYKHFQAKNSLALLKLIKPIRSLYMLPVCLPFKDHLVGPDGRLTKNKIVYVDYVVDVPRDFSEEEKEVKKIRLLPKELCYMFDPALPDDSTRITRNRMMCTTGCGFHSGGPSLIHEETGHWSIVSLAVGGGQCPDPLRVYRPPNPPMHIIIFPYVSWITAAISGNAMGAFAKDDPFGFVMPRRDIYKPNEIGHFWLGHWYMGGIRCFDRGEAAEDMFKFYHEMFFISPVGEKNSYITYNVEIFSEPSTFIVCVKVGMPYRLTKPRVEQVMSPSSRVFIPVIATNVPIRFQIQAWGVNISSSAHLKETSSVSED